ncbi:DUF6177 family protein [Nocardiopsis sp. NPDC058631]|uniref:DUF6177 family protein n=1 Tax=Nocardiopsis sp. NPDC058631 TaxID=3346566 RepID=UPI003655985D
MKEIITLTVGHPPGEEPDRPVLSALVEEFTSRGVLQTMSAHRRTGRPDLGTVVTRASGRAGRPPGRRARAHLRRCRRGTE